MIRKSGLVTLCLVVSVGLLAPAGAQDSSSAPPILGETFDTSIYGWSLSGLWGQDVTPSTMPGGIAFQGTSLNYNDGVDYDNGATNSGTAQSPAVEASPYSRYYVRFKCNYQTETTGTSYDKRIVRIRRNGAVVNSVVLSSASSAAGACAPMGTWHDHRIDVAATANPGDPVIAIVHTLSVEFTFDTVDAIDNQFAGWSVDNLQVTNAGSEPPPTTDDHGNTTATATNYNFSASYMTGRIQPTSDVDYFTWTLPMAMVVPGGAWPTQRYDIRTSNLTGGLDTVLTLYERHIGSSTPVQVATNDDAPGLGLASRIQYTAPLNGQTFYVKVSSYNSSSTGTYRLRVTSETVVNNPDQGNTLSTAALIQVNAPVTNGSISPAGDVDFFKFNPWPIGSLVAGPITFTVVTSNLAGGMDTVLDLYTPEGSLVATNDDAPGLGLASRISYTADLVGTYYVRVRHYSSSGTGSYSIQVTRP